MLFAATLTDTLHDRSDWVRFDRRAENQIRLSRLQLLGTGKKLSQPDARQVGFVNCWRIRKEKVLVDIQADSLADFCKRATHGGYPKTTVLNFAERDVC